MVASVRWRSSSACALAYPPLSSAAWLTTSEDRKVAPKLLTCSPAAARMSKPETLAPSRRAVAIACKPATPAPMTKTFDGARVPAAVVSMGSNLGSSAAPSSTALYPAIVACDESASMDWARVMRGTNSMAKAVTLLAVNFENNSAFTAGCNKATIPVPALSFEASSSDGGRTLDNRSTSSKMAEPSTRLAPADEYDSSE